MGLVALGAAPAAPAKSHLSQTVLVVNGGIAGHVGAKITWISTRVMPKPHHPASYWIITGAHSRFTRAPQIRVLGDGEYLVWQGWEPYADGEPEHDWGNIRWRAFERVGVWAYQTPDGKCDAIIYVRLRVVMRPPRVVHGKTRIVPTRAIATFSYGAYTPAGIRLPVHVRRLG